MRARYWWSVGLVVIAVVALMVLSVAAAPISLARPTSPNGASASTASPASAPSANSAAATPSAPTQPTSSVTPSSSCGSPHCGTLDSYEIAPGGATSEDPAIAYDTVSYEAIINVYQTLVAYNGSSTASFVPELSTCVPGPSNGASSAPSLSCQAKYGDQLVTYSSGSPATFTYPIDKAARFYDPSTKASWPVYPSDVMFSLARTQAFANLPGVATTGGWIQTQAIEPFGSPTWDGGIHYPFNNTPQGALGSILINDSTYCPSNVMADSNGCVTFVANGGGVPWPFFNQLIADALGAGITPCGWFTAQSAGVPGFTGTSASKGDGPCYLPGGGTSTNGSAFQNWLHSTSPTYWDSLEELSYNHPSVQPGVQWNMVGSGPYYLPGTFQQTVGYTLDASPAYAQPSGCVGFTVAGNGCEPAPGAYQGTVNVVYEPTDTQGIQEYVAGQSDYSWFSPPETSTILQLESEGKIGLLHSKTISTYFLPYTFAWNSTTEPGIDPIGTINVPTDFFADNTVRNILNHDWPYTTVQNTIETVDGVNIRFNYGGAIPVGMGNYYPTNISWPYLGGDPDSNTSVNSAAWWWTQGTTSGSPYYDAELAKCTASSPCKFPVIGQQGVPDLDAAIADYIAAIEKTTGGALKPYTFDLTFHDLVDYSLASPYANPMPFFNLGWAPDYPDPTDYMAAMYYANGSYTSSDTLWQVLEQPSKYPQYWSNTTCTGKVASPYATITFADLAWFAGPDLFGGGATPLPNGCSGPAYATMLYWMGVAASLPVGSYRVLVYNLIEHIENQLGFYVWMYQNNGVTAYAKWINPTTINTNVMIGGGNDQTWYDWGYSNQVSPLYLNETGLSSGTKWSVNFAGTTYSGTAPASGTGSIALPGQTAGSYAWSVNYIAGYTAADASGDSNGSVTVAPPAPVSVDLTFAPVSTTNILNVQEIGLTSGLNWTSIVKGYGAIVSNSTIHAYPTLGSTAVTYYIGTQVGYTAYPNNGSATPSAAGVTVSTTFTGLLYQIFSVKVSAMGLGSTSWTVGLGGYTNTSATGGPITFWEPNGMYAFTLSSPSTLTPIASAGLATVAGLNQTINVPFTAAANAATATFKESGLVGTKALSAAPYPEWGVTIGTYTGSRGVGYNFTVVSTATSLSFALNNSTSKVQYNYTVYPMSGWMPSPAKGYVEANTTSGVFNATTITFSMVTYSVTIFEVGLPALINGHPPKWGVNATYTYPGSSVTGYVAKTTSSTAITITLPNGTSPISFVGPTGWSATATSVSVAAAATAAVGVFAPIPFNYAVTFSESGLSGSWTVYVGTVNKTGTGALTFDLPNGTYTYGIVVPSGQSASPAGGTLTVNGTAKAVSVSVSSSPSGTSVPAWAWAVIGVFVVLTLIFLVTTLMGRRRPPAPTAPQSWQPGTGTTETKGGEGGSSPPRTS